MGKFCPNPKSQLVRDISLEYLIPQKDAVNLWSSVGTANEKLQGVTTLSELQADSSFLKALADTYMIGKKVDYTKEQQDIFKELVENGRITAEGVVQPTLFNSLEDLKTVFGIENVSEVTLEDGSIVARVAVPSDKLEDKPKEIKAVEVKETIAKPKEKQSKEEKNEELQHSFEEIEKLSPEGRRVLFGTSDLKAIESSEKRAYRVAGAGKTILADIEKVNKKQLEFAKKFNDDPAALHFLAETAVKYFSYIVTELQINPSAKEKFGLGNFKYDFTTMSREEILSDKSVSSQIYEKAKDILNPEYADEIDNKRKEQLKEAYDNFSILMSLKSDLLKRQEHITLDENGNVREYTGPTEDPNESEETNDKDSTSDEVTQETSPRDTLSMSNNDYSVSTKISQDIKILLSTIQNVDKNGEAIPDAFGFNLPTFIDATESEQTLLNLLQGCETKEEMFQRMETLSKGAPWIGTVLAQLNSDNPTPMQERLSSRFYVDMYKIATRFSQSYTTLDKEGRIILRHKDLGVNKKKDNLLNKIINKYNTGKLGFLSGNTILIGYGTLLGKILQNTYNPTLDYRKTGQKAILGSLYDRFQKTYNTTELYANALNEDLTLNSKSPFYDLYMFLKGMGIDIEQTTLPIMFSSDIAAEHFEDTYAHSIMNKLHNIANTLSNIQNNINQGLETLDNGLTPFSQNYKNNVYYSYRDLIDNLLNFESVDAEPMVYDNNKAHYVYANPAYIQTLVYNLKNKKGDKTKFEKWFKKHYDDLKWYCTGWKSDGSLQKNYNLHMLEKLRYDPSAREILEHSQKLSHNGIKYSQQSDRDYALNILIDYFSDKDKKTAWYRTPIASDKPSNDTIRWFRDSAPGYDMRLSKQAFKIMLQETYRAKSVMEEALAGDKSTMFKYYDINFKNKDKAAQHKKVLDKLAKGETITAADIKDKNGNYLYIGTGASFYYLPELNSLILSDSVIGQHLLDAIFNKGSKINEDINDFISFFKEYMDTEYIQEELDYLNKCGIFDTQSTSILVNPEDPTAGEEIIDQFIHLQAVLEQYKPREIKYLTIEQSYDIIQKALREYFYNNRLVKIQLAELIGGDMAFYGDSTNFQKRFAQSHSSGLMFDKDATIKGKRVFDKEGKLRSLTIKSYKAPSMFKENIRQAFQAKINSLGNSVDDEIKKRALTDIMNNALARYEDVDATDGQAFSCLTSFRKKQIGKGEWSYSTRDDDVNTMTDEAVYKRFLKGTPTIKDFQHVFGQIKKPFVFKKVLKRRNSTTMPVIEVPMQDKNSEYMLSFLGAFVSQYNPDSTMAAIFKWMEDSAQKNPLKGIDTINFDSAVKEGNHLEVIDIADPSLTPSEVIRRLNKAYLENGSYNDTYVDEYDVSEYKEQQINPEHFKEHAQQMGSQERILAIASLDDFASIHYKGRDLSGRTIKDRYFKALINMTRLNADKLSEELNLEGKDREKQYAISKFVKRMFNANQKYNIEDKIAVSIVDGKPVVSWEDESLAEDLQAVLASAVKKSIYQMNMNGGPVVQTTGWGIDRTLHIRFFNKDGQSLLTLDEFAKKMGKTEEDAAKEYSAFVKDNQGSFGYYEAKIPKTKVIKDFAESNGLTKDSDIIKALPKELIDDIIGYRIPTEWKYSIFPIKVVGFTEENSGDSIMLPLDGTLISGFDFDTDKLFVMLKYVKYDKETNKLIAITLDNYDKENPSEEYKAWANEALDMQLAALHDEDSILEMFNPGQFEDLEEQSYIYTLLKSGRYTIDQVSKMSMSQKKDATNTLESGDITRISWDVNMHRLNMVSKDLVAQAAVSSISHNALALVSENYPFYQKIRKGQGFTFDNIPVIDKIQVDPKYAFDGSLISTSLCKYLGAAADGAKNPVLGRIGVSSLAFNVISTFLRWGFSNEQATLFVTQPVIQELLKSYEDAIQDNPGATVSNIITFYERELFKSVNGDSAPLTNLFAYKQANKRNISSDILYNRLALSESERDKAIELDIQLLEIFRTVYKASRQLMAIDMFSRYNSVSNGPESTLGGIISQRDKLRQVDSSLDKNFIGLTLPMLSEALPFISEMIGRTDALVNKAIFDIFPSYKSTLYTETCDTIKTLLGNDYLDPEMQNMIHKAQKLYCFAKPWSTKDSLKGVRAPIIDMADKSTAEHYAFRFVDWYNKTLEELRTKHPDDYREYIETNPFINEIIEMPANKNYPVKALNTNISGISKDKEALIQNGWSKLVTSKNPIIKDLGIELFHYFALRSHLQYSPKTPYHLAPTSVKIAIPLYNTAQDSSSFYTAIDNNELAVQILLNNTNDSNLVPVVNSSELIRYMVKDEEHSADEAPVYMFKIDDELGQFDNLLEATEGAVIVKRIFKDVGGDLLYIERYNTPEANKVRDTLKVDTSTMLSEPFTIRQITPWGAQYDFAEYIPGKKVTSLSLLAPFFENAENLDDSDDGSYQTRRSIISNSEHDEYEEPIDWDMVKDAFNVAGIDFDNTFDNYVFAKNIKATKEVIMSGSKIDYSELLTRLGYKGSNSDVAINTVAKITEKIIKEKNIC